MVEQLKTLARMQLLDDQIGKFKHLQLELPKQLNNLIDAVDQAQVQLLESETHRSQIVKKIKSLELEIKQHNDQIKKYSGQLSEIKTNKEYKALNSEIAYLKTKISDIESIILELMDQEALFKQQVDKDKAVLEEAEKHKREKEGDLRRQIDALEKQIEETRSARNEMALTLPVNVIKHYGSLIKHKNNQAIAYNNAGACSGCGMVLRQQIRIELQLRKKIITCESCSRILLDYFDTLEQ
ncbi:MAG: hypothetical protein FJ042_01790 [Candidatus Cloacimonetes bacterium]|nr:hypothetical protein [Candidatus Cloacimonadota bacterium]